MLFHKWCLFLMRMMSPLAVGLIWFSLIGVSSSSSLHLRNFQENYTPQPTASAEIQLKKNAIHSSFAKYHKFPKAKFSTETPKVFNKNSSSSRPILDNGSGKNVFGSRKNIPNVNLSLKVKVRNGSATNPTMVYFPRFSRSMANFSRNSSHSDLQPIIVSSNRHDLLGSKEYIIRSESDSKYAPSPDIPQHFESKKIKRSQNFTASKPKKEGVKFREPSSSSSSNRTYPFQKTHNLFKKDSPLDHSSSESTAFIRIKSDIKNGTKKNFFVSQISPPKKSRDHPALHLPRKHRRQGRNFDIDKSSISEGEQQSTSNIEISQPILNETKNEDAKVSNTLFNYTYQISAPQRSRLLSRESLLTTPKPEDSEHSEESFEYLLTDLGSSYYEKKAKNLTIYEILKPRLKNSSLANISDEFDSSSNHSSFSPGSDFVETNDSDENVSLYSNSSINSIPYDRKADELTLVTNGIEYETSANSMVVLPGRRDSNYGFEYVMVNRNNSAVVSSLNTNTTDSGKYLDFGKRNISHSQENEGEQTNYTITSDSDADETQELQNKDELNILSRKAIFQEKNDKATTQSNDLNQTETSTALYTTPDENLDSDETEYKTLLYESEYESARKPKMAETINSNNVPYKNPKIDSKMFYDYFAKKPIGNVTLSDFPYPEYRPGNMFRYSDVYQRKPILDAVQERPTPNFKLSRNDKTTVTEESIPITPTTFNSLRTSVRVLSTFYPNRMQDATMKFGNRMESTTVSTLSANKRSESRNEDDPDDAEYRDAIDPGFTMEKLAYLLIGTCCGLSILCLFIVVIAIKCRRAIVEKRIKAQFRKRMYQHERMKDMAPPWQQQMLDHFMYLHRRPGDSSCSSNTDSCNCRCVTWSLGARNLDATRPLCPTNRSSLYLCGQKKLPFGAASSLRYESMLGRKRTSPEGIQQKSDSPNTDSSHENDSLDLDSDSREGDTHKQCTCIEYNGWPMAPSTMPHGFFSLCPNTGRCNPRHCSQHPPVELRTISRDIPPPVTGSNYLDRSEGVVYWSSNEERLI